MMRRETWRQRVGVLGALAGLMLVPVGQAAGADTGRKVLTQPRPHYPELARQMRIWGDIRLLVTILPSGEVERVTVVSGHPLLQNAAREAVQQWRYAAAAETTQADVLVTFTLP